ncbi:hypothetical protein [Paraburkholderia tropica]|uniref:hypothetical protein n=1 Tax=Paraburkholderia tropica TaxID=92647 RepID=UPI0012EAFFF9|nr:hypothetical protein [Paraburkholderia tropica]
MTVAEAARPLFVSRTHILKLFGPGALLEYLSRNPSGQREFTPHRATRGISDEKPLLETRQWLIDTHL